MHMDGGIMFCRKEILARRCFASTWKVVALSGVDGKVHQEVCLCARRNNIGTVVYIFMEEPENFALCMRGSI